MFECRIESLGSGKRTQLCWVSTTVVLHSPFSPNFEKISWRNERFLRMKRVEDRFPEVMSIEKTLIRPLLLPQIVFPRHSTPTLFITVSGFGRRIT